MLAFSWKDLNQDCLATEETCLVMRIIFLGKKTERNKFGKHLLFRSKILTVSIAFQNIIGQKQFIKT